MAALVITSTINQTTASVTLLAPSTSFSLSGALNGARIKAQVSDNGTAWSDFIFFDGKSSRVWLTKQCALRMLLPTGWRVRLVQERAVASPAPTTRVAIE